MAVVKGGRKVVAGAQSGVLNLFSWGHFQDCSDRFPGEPCAAVNAGDCQDCAARYPRWHTKHPCELRRSSRSSL